jgi:hypothetical protein
LNKLHSTKALIMHVVSVMLVSQMLVNQELEFKVI